MKLEEHIAKVLCRAAVSSTQNRPICDKCDLINSQENTCAEGECVDWQLFLKEALAVKEAIRDYARLDYRKKPKPRSIMEILNEQNNGN